MFHAYQLSLDAIRSLRPVVPELRKRSADLANQLQRAASSVALNIAEGSRRIGADRRHFYRIAAGSADEVLAALDTADAWGWPISTEARDQLDHVLAILRKLTRE